MQPILHLALSISSGLAFVLALGLFIKLLKKGSRGELKKVFLVTFLLLCISYALFSSAEILWSIIELVLLESPELGLPDVLWVIGYFIELVAFVYLSAHFYQHYGKRKQGILLMGLISIAVAALVGFWINTTIIGFQEGESTFEIFLDYYYPIISALVFIFAANTYLFFKELKAFGFPMLLLALAAGSDFVAENIYAYCSWNNIYGFLGVISDSFYIIAYLLVSAGFYFMIKLISKNAQNSGYLTLQK